MTATDAPGLTADWLNAWLAAVGVTVLIDDAQLAWTDGPLPHAVFTHPSAAPLEELVADALPSVEDLEVLAIARTHPDTDTEFSRKVTHDSYAARVPLARQHGDPTLAATVTDLDETTNNELTHSPFDPPAPKGLTLWERLCTCRSHLTDPAGQIAATLKGTARRVKANGLGFDHRRILTPTDPVGDKWVDPAIEVLAFAALALFPTRGDGRNAAHRGWTDRPTHPGALRWPTWHQALDAPGIDAYLDRFWDGSALPTAVYSSVAYQKQHGSDPTRGYASRRDP
jgi:hypothetical protein